jgi:hypothetical protein
MVTEQPVDKLVRWIDGDNSRVHCPVCGFDYAHFLGVEKGENTITLVFDGECGHYFGLGFEQYKGHELVHLMQIHPDPLPPKIAAKVAVLKHQLAAIEKAVEERTEDTDTYALGEQAANLHDEIDELEWGTPRFPNLSLQPRPNLQPSGLKKFFQRFRRA